MNYKVFVGIDQSKLTLDVAVSGLEDVHPLYHQFVNDRKGIITMVKWIKATQKCELQDVLFCSENTGVYSLKLCLYLHEINADLWLENPIQIKRSAGLVRGKNDKADARMILRYAMTHRKGVKLYQLPTAPIRTMKKLITFREQLVSMQTTLKITIKTNAEVKADCSEVIKSESESLLKSLAKKIQKIDDEISSIIQADEELSKKYTLTKSVHGVGKQTASLIIAATNGFTTFDDWRKFACFCGIAPFEYTSGTSVRGRTRISQYDHKKLKSLLTMCALNTIKKDNEFKRFFDRRTAAGKNGMSTINIIRNKLISRIFAAIKRGTPYQPEVLNIL